MRRGVLLSVTGVVQPAMLNGEWTERCLLIVNQGMRVSGSKPVEEKKSGLEGNESVTTS